MPKWSKFQPRFRVSNSKWKTGCERRTEEQICSSCMRAYTLLMMGVVLQRTPSVCFRAISWDPSRYRGVTAIQHKSLQEGSESLQQIRQQNKEREFFLHLKKARAAQTGTRDVGDTIVVRTTVGTIKLHKVHISSTQDSQAQQLHRQRLTHSSHRVQMHVNQASRRGLDLSKGTKQYYHALYTTS